jgi:excisionase family DNA binding protein
MSEAARIDEAPDRTVGARPLAAARVLLTAEEVADMTGMGVDWIYAQARLGRIPTVRLGRYRRFRPEAIEQWVRDQEE